MHLVKQLLAQRVERDAPAGARRLSHQRGAVLAHLRDRIAEAEEVLHLRPFAGRAEIAAACLARAFEQMADSQTLREFLPVVPAPLQFVHDWAERERGVRDAPGDD